jgi:hypothetical protein
VFWGGNCAFDELVCVQMAEIATNFPPQTYSSSFFLNSLTDVSFVG